MRDREATAARLEAELQRERIQGSEEARGLRGCLDAAKAAARAVASERDELRLALAVAEAAIIKEDEASDARELSLTQQRDAAKVRRAAP